MISFHYHIKRRQRLKRNEPLNARRIIEPEKKLIAESESIKQIEPEKKRVAKRQRYWKSSEPGCLANRVRYGETKYMFRTDVQYVAR